MESGGTTNQLKALLNKGENELGKGARLRSMSKKNDALPQGGKEGGAGETTSAPEQDTEMARHCTHADGGKAGVFRFNFAKDKQLLVEVKDLNPFGALNPAKVWDAITLKMNTLFPIRGSNRTFSDRTKLLIQKYKANETQSLKRSGGELDFTYFCQLLLEVVQMHDDSAKQREKTYTLSERQKSIDARNGGIQEMEDAYSNDDEVEDHGESISVPGQSDTLEATACSMYSAGREGFPADPNANPTYGSTAEAIAVSITSTSCSATPVYITSTAPTPTPVYITSTAQTPTPVYIGSTSQTPTPAPTSAAVPATTVPATSTPIVLPLLWKYTSTTGEPAPEASGAKRTADNNGNDEGGAQTKQRRGEALKYIRQKNMLELEVKKQELHIKELEAQNRKAELSIAEIVAKNRSAELEIYKRKEEREDERFKATLDILQLFAKRFGGGNGDQGPLV